MACAHLTTILTASLLFASPIKAAMEPTIPDLRNTAKGIENFSYSLLFRCAISMKGQNVIVSPISVWSMMASLSEGAGGHTRDQILAVLGYKTNQTSPSDVFKVVAPHLLVNTPTIRLETVNAIFHQDKAVIDKNYSDLVQKIYRTDIRGVDFSNKDTLTTINNYVQQETNGIIRQIVIPSDLKNSQMILTNGIVFSGQWTRPFNASETARAPFYDENKKQIGEVNMMFQRTALPYVNMDSFKAHVVELPYGKENRLSMIAIVPREGETLEALINKFPYVPVKDIFTALREAQLKYQDDAVDVYFPRFNVTSDYTLNAILSEMGIHELFDPAYADLSQMSPTKGLHVTRAIHKTQIEVIEQGTSAATVLSTNNRIGSREAKFIANKPFLYFIIEKSTDSVVLGGTYVSPSLY